MNERLKEEINLLDNGLKRILAELNNLKGEILELKKENINLRNDLRQKEEEIKNFQNKIKISKIVESIAVENENSAELKSKINDFIKEIDKCIAHLSS